MDDGPFPENFRPRVRGLLYSIGARNVDIHIGYDVIEVFFDLDGKHHWTKPLYHHGGGGEQAERILREIEAFAAERKCPRIGFDAALWRYCQDAYR
jgi:hypothetical protein